MSNTDVLSFSFLQHPGNQYFRSLVDKYQHDYLAAKRVDKPEIATLLVKLVHERGGRFLKRTKITGAGPRGHFCWREIGEQRAYEKACQGSVSLIEVGTNDVNAQGTRVILTHKPLLFFSQTQLCEKAPLKFVANSPQENSLRLVTPWQRNATTSPNPTKILSKPGASRSEPNTALRHTRYECRSSRKNNKRGYEWKKNRKNNKRRYVWKKNLGICTDQLIKRMCCKR